MSDFKALNIDQWGTGGKTASEARDNLGIGNVQNTKNNFSATTAPTTTDDASEGYSVGSEWIDTTADKAYVCLDATAAAAVWTETTQSGGGGWGQINLQYPHDITSGFDTVYYDMTSSDTYIVTTGKTLYITHASSAADPAILKVWWISVIQPTYNSSSDRNVKLINPIIVAAWEDVTTSSGTVYWSWFEVDENSNITEVYNNAGYTVPASKVLIINNWYKTWTWTITMNNGSGAESMLSGKLWNVDNDISMAVLWAPILMNAGDVIVADTANSFTWVLIPDTFIV